MASQALSFSPMGRLPPVSLPKKISNPAALRIAQFLSHSDFMFERETSLDIYGSAAVVLYLGDTEQEFFPTADIDIAAPSTQPELGNLEHHIVDPPLEFQFFGVES